MPNKETIKKIILDFFKSKNHDESLVLSELILNHLIKNSDADDTTNTEEINEAIDELVDNGFVSVNRECLSIKITKKGFDAIFK